MEERGFAESGSLSENTWRPTRCQILDVAPSWGLNLSRPKSDLELLRRARNLRSRLEIETVARGQRAAGLVTAPASQIGNVLDGLKKRGLYIDFCYQSARFEGYAHVIRPPVQGQEPMLSFAYSRDPNTARMLSHAVATNNHLLAGRLLGYPDCCISAFQRRWKEGWVDQIVPWLAEVLAKDTRPSASLTSCPLFRYMGLSFIFHFPCSPTCQSSLQLGLSRFMMLEELDPQLAGWIALLDRVKIKIDPQGLLIAETPLFRMVASTVPIDHPLNVELELIL